MPSFTTQAPSLESHGPVVSLQIAVGTALETILARAGQAAPPPISVDALIDTGASGTVIQQGLAARLGLNPVGVVNIATPSHANVQCYQYLVRCLLPNGVRYEGRVIEAPLQGQNIQCLIGRDVLAHGVLIYIGYGNLFSLSF